MRIGAAYIDGQGHAAGVGQHRPLDAEFAAISGVFPGFFPRPVATWSSPRPCFATAIGFPLARRIPATFSSTICERLPTESTPESNCAAHCPSHIHAAPLSIDSRSARHRRFHRRSAVAANAVARPCDSRDTLATRVPFVPTIHPEDAIRKGSVS